MENKLPEGWEWKKMGEIAEINPKFDRKSISENIEVTFLPMRCIEELTGNVDTSITKSLEEVSKGYTPLMENDLIYAKITPCMENGKVAIAKGLKNNLGFASTEFHVIRFKKNAHNKFFFFYLIQKRIREYAAMNMTGSAGQKRVPATFLKDLLVPLPPLEIQQKIVSILEKAEETKKLRAQADELTQKLLQSVFLEMFGDPVENPKNWDIKQLKDCIKIPLNSGWSPKCSDEISGIPVFSLANLQDQGLSDEITKYYSGDSPKKGLDLEIGDLLISRSNTVELVGRIGRYNGKPEKVIYPDLMIRIRLNENLVNSLFFEKCMQLNSTRKLIQKVSHGTSGSMVKISQGSLLKLPVILPPVDLQQKFAEICNQIVKTTESQNQSSIEINTLFDSLMQKAFTGELVP